MAVTTLFDCPFVPADHTPPMVRRSDPDTAHEAAQRAKVSAGTNRARALHAFAVAYPAALSDFDLAERTGIQQTSVGKRRLELERAGLVYRCPGVTRPSPTGSPAQCYSLTDAGRVLADELARPSAA